VISSMSMKPIGAICLVVLAGCSKPSKGDCDECGFDFYCEDGECVPYCNPPCPPGFYCNHPTGTCFYGPPPDADADHGEPEPACAGGDEDGDWIPDGEEGSGDPDGDTIPSRQDDDIDGDTILDLHEAGDLDCTTDPMDDDEDGAPDYLDLDSDDDGIDDAIEAGDGDPDSRPRDTDGWGHPDFRDTDSDNDTLGDRQEGGTGTDRLVADTDGDGHEDMEEIASLAGDPLDEDRWPGEEERIFELYYRGRSQYESFLFTVLYETNDVVLVVDATWDASAAVSDIEADLETVVVPEMGMVLPGLGTGAASYTGWRMPDVLMDPGCRQPFAGLTRVGGTGGLGEAIARVPRCPEPLLGSSLVGALFETAGDGTATLWPGACAEGEGGACFRESRRILVLVAAGEVPASTPAGYGPYHTLAEVTDLLADRGVHVVGIVPGGTADPAWGPVTGLARGTGSMDYRSRPLVYDAGTDAGSVLAQAAREAALWMVADVTLDVVDADDWPEGPAEIDATTLVTSIFPDAWSPPAGISPLEACRGTESRSFIGCVPGTELAFTAYYRNFSLEQDVFGRVLGVELELRASDGYLFRRIPVRLVVPALNGDSVEEE